MPGSVSPFAQTEEVPFEGFHLIGILGEGGHGTVYAARHRGGDIALKVLRQELALSERERARFLDEAVRMRKVEHHGLVPLLGHGILSDGRPYLCMPRLRGETLASRLTRGKLDLPRAVAVFDTLARAVAVVHRAGLIHRDIKPENVFLESPPRSNPRAFEHPVLLDFGIARDVSEKDSTTTAAGQTRGTPAYMAPERFFGAVANVRTDLYELAVTFYAMLTGRLPWDDTQSAAARLSPRHPADAGAELPSELATVLLRALSTRPEVRPESADAFADLVRRAAASPTLAARTTDAVPVSAGEPSSRPPRTSTAPLTLATHAPESARGGLRWALAAAACAALAVFASVKGAGPAGEPVVAAAAAAAPESAALTERSLALALPLAMDPEPAAAMEKVQALPVRIPQGAALANIPTVSVSELPVAPDPSAPPGGPAVAVPGAAPPSAAQPSPARASQEGQPSTPPLSSGRTNRYYRDRK